MTTVALQTGHEVIAWFARRLGAVVATGTGAGNTVVIEAGGYPCPGGVAVVALRTGLYVIERFSGRSCSVVASCTGAR